MSHKRVWFTENSDRYYDFDDKQLHYRSGEILQSQLFRSYERQLLEYIIDHADRPVPRGEILDFIYSKNDGPELKAIDNHIVNLRKIIDKPLGKRIIATIRGIGYQYTGTKPIGGTQVDITDHYEKLPGVLTKTVGASIGRSKILYREKDLREIEALLANGEKTLLLCGFGGIGKTSLAQLLYTKLASSYDSIGWIVYHGNLKDSMLESIELYENITDPDKRWRLIYSHIKNDKSKKMLFIDNVDLDAAQEQNPQDDALLNEIAGWPYLTIILTSRLPEIFTYSEYVIDALGDEARPEHCIDLFIYYYTKGNPYEARKKKEAYSHQEINIIYELVKRANYHTYAIELLARSAVCENSLSIYLDKIKQIGFQFPSLKVKTNRQLYAATAAKQLQLLFNMRTRSQVQQQILWDFAILPEGTALPQEEVRELLSYSQNDLYPLLQESWLRYRQLHGFSAHPLVREIVLFDLKKGKAPIGTARRLIELTINRKIVSSTDPQSIIFRRLNIIENIAKYVTFASQEEAALFYRCLGRTEYLLARKRLTSIKYLEMSLEYYYALAEKLNGEYQDSIADLKYHTGYIKSSTAQYRNDARYDLEDALKIWSRLDGHEYQIAKAHDHLGYVLSDYPETYGEARFHLTTALKMFQNLLMTDQTEKMQRAYATTCDNLGFLLSKAGDNPETAEQLLFKALEIRNHIYFTTGKFSTDVAWTSYNLGKHLSKDPTRSIEAESHYRNALEIRMELENLHPGMYVNNVMFTEIALAKHIVCDPNRLNEVRILVDDAVKLKTSIDAEHTGFFSEESENDLKELLKIINSTNGK